MRPATVAEPRTTAPSAPRRPRYPRRGPARWLRALALVIGVGAVAWALLIAWSLLPGSGAASSPLDGLPRMVGGFALPAPLNGLTDLLGPDGFTLLGAALGVALGLWGVTDVVRERRARRSAERTATIPSTEGFAGSSVAAPVIPHPSPPAGAGRMPEPLPVAGDMPEVLPAERTESPATSPAAIAIPADPPLDRATAPEAGTPVVEAPPQPPAASDHAPGTDEITPPSFVPRVFISHSSADNDFGIALADHLRLALAGRGDVWYDREGLVGGDDWMRGIERELVSRNVFVVLLSPAALSSPWVEKEVRLALSYAIGQRRVFIPVLHRPVEDVPPFITTYQYVSYLPSRPAGEAFEELLSGVLLGESRLRENMQPLGVRLGPPFDLAQLPPLDHFVGREAALQQVLAQLSAAPSHRSGLASVVAANGMGGIGKSTLAAMALLRLFVDGRFPDGLAVVRCNGLDEPSKVLAQVIERFGIPSEDVSKAPPAQAGRLAQAALNSKDALVVLDNVEPGLPADQVIAPLRAAGVALLVTSRHVLPPGVVPEEATVEIELLSRDEALQLFAESYGRASWAALTPEERAVAERIVDALGRHTLAVALAGVFVSRHRQGRALQGIASDYENSVRRRIGPVATVITTSVAALTTGAQRMFELLGAFPTGDIGRQAILQVAAAQGDTDSSASLEALEDFRLVDAALNTDMPEETDRERIRLHPLVRDVARDALGTWDAAQRTAVTDEIARYYAIYGDDLDLRDVGVGPDQANLVAAITPEAIERAHIRGDDRLVAQMCHAIRLYWRDRGRTADLLRSLPWGSEAAEALARISDARPDLLRAAHLTLTYGQTLALMGRMDDAEAIYQQNLELRRRLQDRRGEGVDLTSLGQVAQARGQLDAAAGYYEQSLAIRRAVQDRQGEGVDLYSLAVIAEAQGDLDRAEALHRESLAIGNEVQSGPDVADSLLELGRFLVARRDNRDEGCRMLREAVHLYAEMGLPDQEADAQETLRDLGCDA
jgi:hypothetical protein